MNLYNVLIIDDHPIVASAYEAALFYIQKQKQDYSFRADKATSIDAAQKLISEKSNGEFYHLIFLDVKLPKSSDGELLSGEDLGIEIRKISPKSKIIVGTTYNDSYRINNILKSVNPDGFLVKDDTSPEDLIEAIKSVMKDTPYYSATVVSLLRKYISHEFYLDKIDRQLLYELSIGTKMVDLPNVIAMSMGGLERRKRQLKEIFNISGQDDKVLVAVAKEKGFL